MEESIVNLKINNSENKANIFLISMNSERVWNMESLLKIACRLESKNR